MRARFYNPVVGRFVQEDIYHGDGLNLYAYCGNNPIRYCDPSGYAKGKKSCKSKSKQHSSQNDFIVSENGVVEAVSNGQHVLEKHVGKSDSDLLNRLKKDTNISGSSTFTDDIIANKVINSTITDAKNINKISNWLNNGAKGNLPLNYKGSNIIGRGASQGSNIIKNLKNAKVILKNNGKGGYYILTAYPK